MTDGPRPHFNEIVASRYSRRQALKGLGGSAAAIALMGAAGGMGPAARAVATAQPTTSLGFHEIAHRFDATHHVAPGYRADVLIRWGDPVVSGAPGFDPTRQSPGAQARQFGYNNDFTAFLPLPAGSDNSDHGLLFVNHEYTTTPLMFPGYGDFRRAVQTISEADAAVEMEAHGASIIEIRKEDNRWRVVADSRYARRLSATTPMELTGPAAGHERLRTSGDPSGARVIGMLNNCSGGRTPWGTVLTAEENFHFYFAGDLDAATRMAPGEAGNYDAYQMGYRMTPNAEGGMEPKGHLPRWGWFRHDERFRIDREPREANRFGWLVEVDPYDPDFVPKKRTALGRFSHESGNVVAQDGQPVVVYTGDDRNNEFLYRFVSSKPYRAGDRPHNLGLLDEGTLYAARFHPNGSGEWIPLLYDGNEQLLGGAGMANQGDVLIEARRAARLLGATALDRPEDIATSPATGRTYLALTNNSERAPHLTDPVNPRAGNEWGHIVELMAPGEDGSRDHTGPHFEWDMLLLAGDPHAPVPGHRGMYHPDISRNGWFMNPDNLEFDPRGRLWIATDGFSGNSDPVHDGLWACDVTGDGRALTRHFFGCPRGAEMCGPSFTPDGRTLFLAIQHPGQEEGSNYKSPTTRWPDFDPQMPPRPAVVVVTREDGGEIGS